MFSAIAVNCGKKIISVNEGIKSNTLDEEGALSSNFLVSRNFLHEL